MPQGRVKQYSFLEHNTVGVEAPVVQTFHCTPVADRRQNLAQY